MALRKDFLYGFATASAQIEGGGPESEKESGRGMSVGPRWAGIELESILIVARFTFSFPPPFANFPSRMSVLGDE